MFAVFETGYYLMQISIVRDRIELKLKVKWKKKFPGDENVI